MRRIVLLVIVGYILVGVIVAASRDYFVDIKGLRDVINTGIGVFLWPLLLAGVKPRIGVGKGGESALGALWAVLLIGSRRTKAPEA